MMIIIIALSVVIVLQTILHYIERKDLYNRIMCKSIGEYKAIDEPIQKHTSAHNRVLKKWKNRAGDE